MPQKTSLQTDDGDTGRQVTERHYSRRSSPSPASASVISAGIQVARSSTVADPSGSSRALWQPGPGQLWQLWERKPRPLAKQANLEQIKTSSTAKASASSAGEAHRVDQDGVGSVDSALSSKQANLVATANAGK